MQYRIKEWTEFSDNALYVFWEDGHESIYLYTDLRDICPCAGCGKSRKSVKERLDIRPLRIENVGHYAIRFYWSDGHSTGIYTFALLRNNCSCVICNVQG